MRYYETFLKKKHTTGGEAYLLAEFPTMKDVEARIGPPDAADDVHIWYHLASYTPDRTETLHNSWRLTDSGKRFGKTHIDEGGETYELENSTKLVMFHFLNNRDGGKLTTLHVDRCEIGEMALHVERADSSGL